MRSLFLLTRSRVFAVVLVVLVVAMAFPVMAFAQTATPPPDPTLGTLKTGLEDVGLWVWVSVIVLAGAVIFLWQKLRKG